MSEGGSRGGQRVGAACGQARSEAGRASRVMLQRGGGGRAVRAAAGRASAATAWPTYPEPGAHPRQTRGGRVGGISRSRSEPWRAPVSAPPPSRLAGVGSGGRTHRARVSARPTAALVQLSLGLAPLQPARLQGAGRNPLPAWHSPSGMIFLGGAGGGCSGPSVDTRKPAGRVSAEVPNMPPLW